MLSRIARFAILRLVQLFYPRIEVRGRAHLPAHGRVLFVANHPNGLLDALVMMLGTGRHMSFLAKSTFFANPLGRLAMEAFDALPVYRQRDEGREGGAQGDRANRNEQTFARCRALLRSGRPLALFPEGTTHSNPMMLPLRTGAARVALSAAAEAGWLMDLQIVPVGLWYQNKARFRSAALLVVGQPFDLSDYAAAYAADPHAAVDALTGQIDAHLDAVVLQAENAEVLQGIAVLADWTATREPASLEEQHARTAALLAAYQRLREADPARLAAIERRARRYARVLHTLGVDDPWDLELNTVRRGRIAWLALALLLGLLPALAGFALSYGTYRLAAPLTPLLLGKHEETTSTGKLIIGSGLVLLGWVVAAIVCGALLGVGWGAGLLALSPLLAYVALRWGEGWHELREAVEATWLTLRHGALVRDLVARRQMLVDEVARAQEAVQTLERSNV
ncbi:MAG: 1-acyl-sn-glycerol-3-phosphate acyltransferase [Kouleothrix sp.]|nr:1-acyl-sn-glycerol-3-phosphate acyltransferase [Kouleothrix sp.]